MALTCTVIVATAVANRKNGKQRIVWCMIAYILQKAVPVSHCLGNY